MLDESSKKRRGKVQTMAILKEDNMFMTKLGKRIMADGIKREL